MVTEDTIGSILEVLLYWVFSSPLVCFSCCWPSPAEIAPGAPWAKAWPQLQWMNLGELENLLHGGNRAALLRLCCQPLPIISSVIPGTFPTTPHPNPTSTVHRGLVSKSSLLPPWGIAIKDEWGKGHIIHGKQVLIGTRTGEECH